MNLNQEQANKLAMVLLEANTVYELADKMQKVFGIPPVPEKKPDVSRLRFRGTDPVEIAEPYKRCPVDGEIWLCGPGAIGFGAWNNPVWILRVVEQPPDVSHLRCNGLRVEIAEPKKRIANDGDLWYCEMLNSVKTCATVDKYWILRTIPLSVYGCDPKSVDLSKLRGPNGFPVEWVDFREPVEPENWVIPATSPREENELLFDPKHARFCWVAPQSADKRRIIVREVKPKPKARQWIATECLNQHKAHCGHRHVDTGADHYKGMSAWSTVADLADLDDIKVQYAIAHAVGWSDISISDRAKLVAGIRHYLLMNPTK